MRAKSKRWHRSHEADVHVRKARQDGFRSRAAYKLLEIDQRDHLLTRSRCIVELGSAPGAWSQLIRLRAPNSKVYAVDRLPMQPVAGVNFIQGDFLQAQTATLLMNLLAGQRVELVLSDMAPNISGVRDADQAQMLELAEGVFEFSCKVLQVRGNLLLKIFQAADMDAFRKRLQKKFGDIVVRKPKASKLQSRETYLLARNFHLG